MDSKPLAFQAYLAVVIVTIHKKGGLPRDMGEVSFRIFDPVSVLSRFRNGMRTTRATKEV